MFREYAVEPAVISSWERARYFLDAFGPSKGRFLAEFPKGWTGEVYRRLKCPPVEKKRIEEKLSRLDKRVFSARDYAHSNATWLGSTMRSQSTLARRLPQLSPRRRETIPTSSTRIPSTIRIHDGLCHLGPSSLATRRWSYRRCVFSSHARRTSSGLTPTFARALRRGERSSPRFATHYHPRPPFRSTSDWDGAKTRISRPIVQTSMRTSPHISPKVSRYV